MDTLPANFMPSHDSAPTTDSSHVEPSQKKRRLLPLEATALSIFQGFVGLHLIDFLQLPELKELGLVCTHLRRLTHNGSLYRQVLSQCGLDNRIDSARTCATRVRHAMTGGNTIVTQTFAEKLIAVGNPHGPKLMHAATLLRGFDVDLTQPNHNELAARQGDTLLELDSLGIPPEIGGNNWSTFARNRARGPGLTPEVRAARQIHFIQRIILGFSPATDINRARGLATMIADSEDLVMPTIRMATCFDHVLEDLVSLTPAQRITAWQNWRPLVRSQKVEGSFGQFLSLLDLQRRFLFDALDAANDLTIANSLDQMSKDKRITPHVRALASIQLALQRLSNRTNIITDADACQILSDLNSKPYLRIRVRLAAEAVLWRFFYAHRCPEHVIMGRDVLLFANLCLIAPDLTESIRGIMVDIEQIAKQLMVDVHVRNPAFLATPQLLQYADDLSSNAQFPEPLQRQYEYAKAFFRYKLGSPDPRAPFQDRDAVVLLQNLLESELNPQINAKTSMILIRMHIDGRTCKRHMTDATAFTLLKKTWEQSAPDSFYRAEVALLLNNLSAKQPMAPETRTRILNYIQKNL